ncbi:MAG: FAD-dependent oxidoreductase, partial [Actinomycetota bacterium]|nr:FAD-dependent oxidoreductase [Actinomycetota bacterium]
VTVLEGEDRLLPRNEPEAGEVLRDVFAAEGITVSTGQFAASIEYDGSKFAVTMADGSTRVAEQLLVAAGRRTFLRELGVEHLGIDPDAPFLASDERMRVTDGVWAVGDIAGDGLFTHLAIRQADIAAADILGNDTQPLNLAALSAVTFTDPEVGAVGMTEAEARDAGLDVPWRSNPWAIRHAAGCTQPATRVSSSSWSIVDATSSWERPRSAHTAARCWASSRWRCTPRSRPAPCAR